MRCCGCESVFSLWFKEQKNGVGEGGGGYEKEGFWRDIYTVPTAIAVTGQK